MSGTDESFLARWSRRKEAARRETGTLPDEPVADEAEAARVPAPAEEGASEEAVAPEEAPVPVEELPPIDSIGPETDLRPWLRRNVPAAWRQAALRRLWVSDPGIRDFVGPADYAWDWNTPGGMPGYGPLDVAETVRERLLAQVEGRLLPASEGAPADPAETAAARPEEPVAKGAANLPDDAGQTPPDDGAPAGGHADVKGVPEEPEPLPRRRSGSATPA